MHPDARDVYVVHNNDMKTGELARVHDACIYVVHNTDMKTDKLACVHYACMYVCMYVCRTQQRCEGG
jgi:hypothetical protein